MIKIAKVIAGLLTLAMLSLLQMPGPGRRLAERQRDRRLVALVKSHPLAGGDASSATLVGLRESKTAKEKRLHDVFGEAGVDHSAGGNDVDRGRLDLSSVKSIDGSDADKAKWISDSMDEINDLGKQIETLADTEIKMQGYLKTDDEDAKRRGAMRHDGAASGESGHDGSPTVKSVDLGELFIKSQAYKGYKNGSGIGPQAELKEIEVKTLFQTSAGWAIENTRTGKLVLDAQRPVAIVNVLPQTTTTQAAVVYMEETTFTNAAAEAAEAGTYAESALVLTERTSNVRKIATFLPVTDEQLADEPRARDYVNNRLMFMLRQRLDGQIIAGDGNAPNLEGILNVTGIGSQALGADPVPDAVYKAMDLCRVNGFAEPDNALFHPTDWQAIRLLRTADGIYLWGAPSDPGPARIWGIPVTLSTAVTLNSAVVGAFREFSELASRQGIDIQVSNSHSTFFIEGTLAIRADVRVALIFYRPAAFAEITGI